MNINDFSYLVLGNAVASFFSEEASLLEPIRLEHSSGQSCLLLLHGFTSSPAVFRELIPKLKFYDNILCPRLSGHGESLGAFNTSTANDWLKSARSACLDAFKRYKKVDILGLSLGGLMACMLAKEFKFNHMYLLAPAIKLKLNIPFIINLTKFCKKLGFIYTKNMAGSLCNKDTAELAYRQLPLNAVLEILTFIENFQFTPPKCPTDIFLGKYDNVVDSKKVQKLFTNLDETKIHTLENTAHVLPLDNDREEIVKIIKQNYSA